ncbi:hypothetical protein [Dehalobacter sp. TeCB1]|uniref:hypothetical protein n=1 Tax=Dehalobacter sp. TeCB1 TaxID=1843715 RepID=UPI00083A85F0|nr:hypothetical protein [Dehalobacter sp. TeCB1]OCZ54314.1 hypothetical protein A7D23_05970 [Dehalobacter sp. TeCB1]
MPRSSQKMTNSKYGICLDMNGDGGLTDEKFIPGSRFEVQFPNLAAAQIPGLFWTAPYPCKVIRAYERHVTVAGQAGTMQVEKTPSGTAPGSGTATLATAFDLTSTANTNVSVSALTTAAAQLAAGDSLSTKLASGAATSYAGGCLSVVLEWT